MTDINEQVADAIYKRVNSRRGEHVQRHTARDAAAIAVAIIHEQTCEWQPIETVPKDRKAVLLYVPENKCTYTAVWIEQRGWWEIFGGDWRAHLQRASHWMPLPLPPQEAKRAD